MTRPSDTLLGSRAYARGTQAPMINVQNGGQNGWMPDYASYLSSTNYVRRNIIARVVEFPRGFNLLPEPELLKNTLKSIVELHPLRIEGLQQGITWEFAETQFGGAGEMQQDPTNATRARSAPSFTWVDRYGRPIQRFIDYWGRQLIMDPETKYPLIVTDGNADITDLLPDMIAMTVLFFEPDPTHTRVDKAWLCANMMPQNNGPVDGTRDIATAGQTNEFSVEFTALTQVGQGVIQFAQEILDDMNLAGANPNLRKAFASSISPDAARALSGYKEKIAEAARNTVTI